MVFFFSLKVGWKLADQRDGERERGDWIKQTSFWYSLVHSLTQAPPKNCNDRLIKHLPGWSNEKSFEWTDLRRKSEKIFKNYCRVDLYDKFFIFYWQRRDFFLFVSPLRLSAR